MPTDRAGAEAAATAGVSAVNDVVSGTQALQTAMGDVGIDVEAASHHCQSPVVIVFHLFGIAPHVWRRTLVSQLWSS